MNSRCFKKTLVFLLLLTMSSHGATLFHTDDFSDGLEGWAGGASPTRIATGGPGGAGDAFMQIGNDGRLATFNEGSDWSGDFATATILGITVDLMGPAMNPEPLPIRVVLFGPTVGHRWTSTVAQLVPNDGVWRNYSFSLLEEDLTQVFGTGDFAEAIGSVERFMLRFDPDPPSAMGTPVVGTLGIDNISTVPEPGMAILLGLAGMFVSLRRCR